MKQIITSTILSLLLISSNIYAVDVPKETIYKNYPFIGANGVINVYSFYGVPGATIYGGYRWSRFGLELGYTKLADDEYDDHGEKYKASNTYLDGIVYVPLGSYFDLKGKLGVGLFRCKYYPGSELHWIDWSQFNRTNTVGARFGVGLDYKLTKRISTGVGYTLQVGAPAFFGVLNIFTYNITYNFL